MISIAQKIQKKKAEESLGLNLKIYNEVVWCRCKDRYTEKCNRNENLEINPSIYGHIDIPQRWQGDSMAKNIGFFQQIML